MKKLFVLIVIFSLCEATLSGKNCECGSREKGTYAYSVGDKQGCCTGTAGDFGSLTIWELGEGDTWEVTKYEHIGGKAAQKACCS